VYANKNKFCFVRFDQDLRAAVIALGSNPELIPIQQFTIIPAPILTITNNFIRIVFIDDSANI